MSLKPTAAILVLNFNGKHFLGDCFRSLEKTRWPNTVYLVDNGSTDGSVDHVMVEFPYVKIIQHDGNYGFCEGYNRAVTQVDEKYVLLLNNDTEVVDSEWLGNMMAVALADEKVGVVGAKLVSREDIRVLDAVGGKVWRWGGIGVRIGAGEQDKGQYDNPPIEPFCVLGAAMLIKRDLFIESGGFDPAMYAYSEELDLCWRLRLRGYSVKYSPGAVIRHHSSGSWSRMKVLKLYLSSRNFLRSCLKNYSWWSLLREIPPLLAISFLGTLMASVVARNPRISMSTLRGIAWNLVNLRGTFRERIVVQRGRVADEKRIIEAMGDTPMANIRSVLNHLSLLRQAGNFD